MDKIIRVRISEKEKKIIDQFINEKKFKDHDEFIQKSIRHYLFALIEEKLDTIRDTSMRSIDDINMSVRESRAHTFEEFFSDKNLFR
jgi:Arc/MetJ-type ribon-helix-helix transcriptional regulator